MAEKILVVVEVRSSAPAYLEDVLKHLYVDFGVVERVWLARADTRESVITVLDGVAHEDSCARNISLLCTCRARDE